MPIHYVPEIANDLAVAREWYEGCSVGLGLEFMQASFALFSELVEFPDKYERVNPIFRRALMHRFPYAVFYVSDGDEITVYGVFHTSRDPDWISEALGLR